MHIRAVVGRTGAIASTMLVAQLLVLAIGSSPAAATHQAGMTTRVSVSSSGAQATRTVPDAGAHTTDVSSNGRFIAFSSDASNLVSGDTNTRTDVFVRDLVTRATTRVSLKADGSQATSDDPNMEPSISGDGRFVAFTSGVGLVSHDVNFSFDVYVRDRTANTTTLVSGRAGGNANGLSTQPSMSDDGRFVAFTSTSSDLAPGDTNAVDDIFIHDRNTGSTSIVSVGAQGVPANQASDQPAISADGRYVAFVSRASNLVSGDTNNAPDVFVRDRTANTTTRVSVSANGAQVTQGGSEPSISADGGLVAFSSLAPNLVSGDTNATSDVFVRDRVANTTTRVSVGNSSAQGNSEARTPSISGNGRYVVFMAAATNLVPGDTNGAHDVFVRDVSTRTTTRVSVRDDGGQANGGSYLDGDAVSTDGRVISFESSATNLVDGDTNNWEDVFAHERTPADLSVGDRAVAEGASGTKQLRFPITLSTAMPWTVTVRWSTVALSGGASAGSDFVMASGTATFAPGQTLVEVPTTINGDAMSEPDERFTVVLSAPLGAATLRGTGTGLILADETAPSSTVRINAGGTAYTRSGTATTWSADRGSIGGAPLFTSAAIDRTIDDPLFQAARNGVAGYHALVPNGSYQLRLLYAETGATPAVGGRVFDVAVEGSLLQDNFDILAAVPRNTAFTFERSITINDGQLDVVFTPVTGGPLVSAIELFPSPPTTSRVSVSSADTQANNDTREVSISADGRYVAFSSFASNLVPNDTNSAQDVFLRDRIARTTTRVSVSSSGAQGNLGSGNPAISADGRFVAFGSGASNLVGGDSNGRSDIFVRDLVNNTTARVSVASNGAQATGESLEASISGDGRYIAFESAATSLVSGDTNSRNDIFVRDRVGNTTTRVSVTTSGGQADGASSGASISRDGRIVAFGSTATNLVTGDTNGARDVFVRDRTAATTTRISVATGGAQTTGFSQARDVSDDGRYVVFSSDAPNLVSGDTNARTDVFVRDRSTGSTTRVSIGNTGAQATGGGGGGWISGDGRYVVFFAVPDTAAAAGSCTLCLRDRTANTTQRAVLGGPGSDIRDVDLSADGRQLAFTAPLEYVSGDTNDREDAHIHGPLHSG